MPNTTMLPCRYLAVWLPGFTDQHTNKHWAAGAHKNTFDTIVLSLTGHHIRLNDQWYKSLPCLGLKTGNYKYDPNQSLSTTLHGFIGHPGGITTICQSQQQLWVMLALCSSDMAQIQKRKDANMPEHRRAPLTRQSLLVSYVTPHVHLLFSKVWHWKCVSHNKTLWKLVIMCYFIVTFWSALNQ